MGAATSKDIALAVLIPLPFDIISTALRFWIRMRRKAWGPDDWAMLVNIPCWLISIVGLIGMAWSGVGAPDATLSEEQRANSLFWFFLFQEWWCFTLIAIKWSIGFTLMRIAHANRGIEIVIYTCLVAVTLVMGGTGMYLFFQCLPAEKNWHPDTPGTCQPREIQTALSYTVAAVSITTDWIFAITPFFLIWNLQMDIRIKLSVIGLLGLGVFASIAPIVRLKYIIGLNDETKFIENLGPILAWAAAEMNIGMLVSNLPACRPLLEDLLAKFTSLTGSRTKSAQYPPGTTSGPQDYVELAEGVGFKGKRGLSRPGIDTRIYGKDMPGNSDESLADDGSERRIVARPSNGNIHVQTSFTTEVSQVRKQDRADAGV